MLFIYLSKENFLNDMKKISNLSIIICIFYVYFIKLLYSMNAIQNSENRCKKEKTKLNFVCLLLSTFEPLMEDIKKWFFLLIKKKIEPFIIFFYVQNFSMFKSFISNLKSLVINILNFLLQGIVYVLFKKKHYFIFLKKYIAVKHNEYYECAINFTALRKFHNEMQ